MYPSIFFFCSFEVRTKGFKDALILEGKKTDPWNERSCEVTLKMDLMRTVQHQNNIATTTQNND